MTLPLMMPEVVQLQAALTSCDRVDFFLIERESGLVIKLMKDGRSQSITLEVRKDDTSPGGVPAYVHVPPHGGKTDN